MADFKDTYKLTTNPFRLTPSIKPDELVWAGFNDVKTKFEKRIERSIRIPNSTLVLNWGEYGSGKTHAARFFNKKDELKTIGDKAGRPIPYSMVISLPKGKDPIYSIYMSVIDKLNITLDHNLENDVTVRVSDFMGRMVLSRSLNNVKIDLGIQPNTVNGLYFVEVKLQDTAGNQSIVTTTDTSQ